MQSCAMAEPQDKFGRIEHYRSEYTEYTAGKQRPGCNAWPHTVAMPRGLVIPNDASMDDGACDVVSPPNCESLSPCSSRTLGTAGSGAGRAPTLGTGICKKASTITASLGGSAPALNAVPSTANHAWSR